MLRSRGWALGEKLWVYGGFGFRLSEAGQAYDENLFIRCSAHLNLLF